MDSTRAKRWKSRVKWILLALGIAFVARAAWRFPWRETGEALLGADVGLLLLAAVISPISFLVKGWAWHLLLKPVAPHRWRDAQEANWIGAMVNILSISVAGEAVRVHRLVQRARVPVGRTIVSVAGARVCEGIGLALFILVVPSLVRQPVGLRQAQLGAAVALGLLGIVLALRGIFHLPVWLPRPVRATLEVVREIGSPGRLVAPVGFALVDWAVQWITYHLVLAGTHAHPTAAASFMAVLATNLAGLLRVTPANVGVFQISMALGLAPYGISASQAVAAGLALQAVQIPPTLLIGALWLGMRGIRQLRAEVRANAGAPPASESLEASITES